VYEKFVEAKELAAAGYVFPVSNADECKAILQKLIADYSYRSTIHNNLLNFMRQHTGATQRTLDMIAAAGWLS
jgi:3-deoxy-D-manno-octulosonic-acid transferase